MGPDWLAGFPSVDDDPEAAWAFIVDATRRARTAEEFGQLAAGPLDTLWSEYRGTFMPRLTALADELPALVNLVVAIERRLARAIHVMNLLDGEAPTEFTFTPAPELAALVRPGAHPLTEELLVPREYGRPVSDAEPPSDAEVAEIIEGYIVEPSPPEDDPDSSDWGWALDRLNDFPHVAWRAILTLISREKDGVELGFIGAGPLETLLHEHGDLLAPELLAEIESNPDFVRAMSASYLFGLSEELLIKLSAKQT